MNLTHDGHKVIGSPITSPDVVEYRTRLAAREAVAEAEDRIEHVEREINELRAKADRLAQHRDNLKAWLDTPSQWDLSRFDHAEEADA